MHDYDVNFGTYGRTEVKGAKNRNDAIVKAAKILGIDNLNRTFLYAIASVHRLTPPDGIRTIWGVIQGNEEEEE